MIPGLISPPPFFGRTGLFPAGVTHFALSNGLTFESSGAVSKDALIYGARADLSYMRRRLRGDPGGMVRSDKGGAFDPVCHLIRDGRIYLGGRLIADGNNSQSVLFVADAGPNPVWDMQSTGIEGPKGSGGYRSIVGIAASGDTVAALSSTGEVAVSEAGGAWEAFGNVGFTGGVDAATGLVGGDPGFLAFGNNGQAFTVADPAAVWTPRDSTFGGATVVSGLVVGSRFVIGGQARLATADGLANFTARSVPGGALVEKLFGVPGRLYAGGFDWLTSTDGEAWTVPADQPDKGGSSRIRSGYKAGGRWVIHWGDGQVSTSENDTEWVHVAGDDLPGGQGYAVSFAI